MAFIRPLVPILRPVVDQQQDASTGDAVRQHVEQRLRLRVDPVQVLEDHDDRLLEAFAQDYTLDRVERPLQLDRWRHLRERICALYDAEQSEQVWQRVFEGRGEPRKYVAHLLSPRRPVISI